MEKSKEIEEIGTAISECLTKLYETKEPLSFNPFPKMYHPTDDSLNIPLIVGSKKIIIEIKST
jgi:hypothetical protein